MPNVIVCYKWVLDEADLRVGPGGALNLDNAGRKISEYDRNALEEAALITEKHGGTITAVSLGGPEIKASAKDALSRGPNSVILAMDPTLQAADAHTTALGLAAAVRTLSAYDLILCGEGSGDQYAQQVGPRMAALLRVPCISYVNKLTLDGDHVICERKLEEGVEVVRAQLPVVVTVLPDLNKPRIPGLKQVMGAAKKPQVVLDAKALGFGTAELTPRLSTLAVKAPLSNRKKLRVQNVAELAQQLVSALS